jgi:hypothetical protein
VPLARVPGRLAPIRRPWEKNCRLTAAAHEGRRRLGRAGRTRLRLRAGRTAGPAPARQWPRRGSEAVGGATRPGIRSRDRWSAPLRMPHELGPAPQDARESLPADPRDGGRARRSHLEVRRDRGATR